MTTEKRGGVGFNQQHLVIHYLQQLIWNNCTHTIKHIKNNPEKESKKAKKERTKAKNKP